MANRTQENCMICNTPKPYSNPTCVLCSTRKGKKKKKQSKSKKAKATVSEIPGPSISSKAPMCQPGPSGVAVAGPIEGRVRGAGLEAVRRSSTDMTFAELKVKIDQLTEKWGHREDMVEVKEKVEKFDGDLSELVKLVGNLETKFEEERKRRILEEDAKRDYSVGLAKLRCFLAYINQHPLALDNMKNRICTAADLGIDLPTPEDLEFIIKNAEAIAGKPIQAILDEAKALAAADEARANGGIIVGSSNGVAEDHVQDDNGDAAGAVGLTSRAEGRGSPKKVEDGAEGQVQDNGNAADAVGGTSRAEGRGSPKKVEDGAEGQVQDNGNAADAVGEISRAEGEGSPNEVEFLFVGETPQEELIESTWTEVEEIDCTEAGTAEESPVLEYPVDLETLEDALKQCSL